MNTTLSTPQSNLHRALPVIALLLAVVFVLYKTPRGEIRTGDYNLHAFSLLPSTADGRVKPLDTVARTSLQVISGVSEFKLEGKRKQPAIVWLADTMAKPEQARTYPIFRIDDTGVLNLIGIKSHSRNRYSFNDILAHRDAFLKQVELASQVAPRERNLFQRHVMELWSHVQLFMSIQEMQYPYLVPPDQTRTEWRPMTQAVDMAKAHGQEEPAALLMSNILFKYQQDQPEEFNQAIVAYQNYLTANNPDLAGRLAFEVFFNRLSPFYLCTILYMAVFVLAAFSFLFRANASSNWAQTLGRSAMWILLLTLAIHTFGLAARIYLQGRPPVTNLYSSAVFIGWGAVVLAILLELPFRLSIGTLVSSLIGFVTLIIAMNLAEGDTMEMMQAVLDSNFWLATHVIIITIGYSSTFLAGLLGVMYILGGTMTRMITPELDRVFARMVYGVICFSLLMSFTGTVLGGIWADQSWGRFWGWDPKENGAILIVLWNALILHARWGGMVRTRGIMVLAVFGNIITAWSWFGTNMLGVGLHSYGFMNAAFFWLAAFKMSQVGVILAGLLPLPLWKSFATHPTLEASAVEKPQA